MNLSDLTNRITNIHHQQSTLLIGIDGLGGAGKSTISEQLCNLLQANGFHTTVLHIDDFIHPKTVRYQQNQAQWKCYYYLQWRYDYLFHEVITPLKQKTELHRDIELYDKEYDTYRLQRFNIPIGSIVIVEGIFLQRKELRSWFDYMIYLDIPEKIRLERVQMRDGYIGNVQQITEKYTNRYFPAEHHYIAKYSPSETADYIIKTEL